METIRQAYVAGRIGLEELRNRAAVTFLAATTEELASLTADLGPGGSARPARAPRRFLASPAKSWPRGWHLVVLLAWLGLVVAASLNSGMSAVAVVPFGLAVAVAAPKGHGDAGDGEHAQGRTTQARQHATGSDRRT